MNPRMHPRGHPRATARDLRSHVLNDQIVIQSILTHEFDGPAPMAQRNDGPAQRWPSADLDLLRYELILIEIRVELPKS